MKRKNLIWLLVLTLSLSLCACGGEPKETTNPMAGRMVKQIEIAIHPEDEAFSRSYVTQENMNALLSLLRGMVTDEAPEEEPDLNGGQSYYTATVTFANGDQSIYYLLGHTYLRLGNDPWCTITTAQSMKFTDFIDQHPSDDGTTPETTAPPETTVPETTV